MKTLVIEREAVKNNIGVIKERAGEAVIYAVLTGDGQGAGLVELARLLREEGIGRFAVSEPPRPPPCAGRALWRRRF